MKKIMLFGIGLVIFSLFINFQFLFTGFSVIETTKIINPSFLIIFLLGISMIFVSSLDLTGGLEQALNDDTVGVITFVRHAEKDEKGILTEEGRKQARALGANFKKIYEERNEGKLYLAASSSPVDRAYETVKEIMGIESKYNKPVRKDKRLLAVFHKDVELKCDKIFEKQGPLATDNYYLASKSGLANAKNYANFLEEIVKDLKKVLSKEEKFHYITGTHDKVVESLLKRVMIKDGKIGFDSVEEIGGTLKFAESINFMLKKDGSYQVNFRNHIYDIDMDKLDKLAEKK